MVQTSIASWLRQPKVVQSLSPSSIELKDQELQSASAQSLSTSFVTSSILPASSVSAPSSSLPATLAFTQRPRGSIRPMPLNVTIEPCTQNYVNSFRRLNALLLPIPYQDRFYRDTLNDSVIASLTRIALWHDAVPEKCPSGPRVMSSAAAARLVAAIRCRLLPFPPPNNTSQSAPTLYISTITTLSPWRKHSLATHLLATVIQTAVKQYGVTSVMAHVWEANEEAMEWYRRRGFKVVGREECYYKRLAPKSAAWVVSRDVRPGDLLESEEQRTEEHLGEPYEYN